MARKWALFVSLRRSIVSLCCTSGWSITTTGAVVMHLPAAAARVCAGSGAGARWLRDRPGVRVTARERAGHRTYRGAGQDVGDLGCLQLERVRVTAVARAGVGQRPSLQRRALERDAVRV